MKRSEAMLRLALNNDIINITSNRETFTEEPCTSNYRSKESDVAKSNIQLEYDKENLRSSNNMQISINEQCEGWDKRNASELSDVIVESENNKTGSSYSNYSSSSSSDSSSSSNSSSDEDSDDSVRDPNFVAEQLPPRNSSSESDLEDNNENVPVTSESTSSNLTVSIASTSRLSSRKRQAKPAEWKQNKSKILRNSGAAYINVKNVHMRDINSRVINTVISKRTSINTVEEDKRGKHQNHHSFACRCQRFST
ncbi:unnamed protein product [Arctia plantaginis]|uniref:Uncharacterized protein n=1 Tax=Arctia plantaginis TaxID=874455 RepID=A0A8S0ZQ36_ARCPL|nr:unnamed protein product [Arctia plantaginis]